MSKSSWIPKRKLKWDTVVLCFYLTSRSSEMCLHKVNDMADHSVAESGVQLLTAQKPIKRSSWWKGKFALF